MDRGLGAQLGIFFFCFFFSIADTDKSKNCNSAKRKKSCRKKWIWHWINLKLLKKIFHQISSNHRRSRGGAPEANQEYIACRRVDPPWSWNLFLTLSEFWKRGFTKRLSEHLFIPAKKYETSFIIHLISSLIPPGRWISHCCPRHLIIAQLDPQIIISNWAD